MPPVFSDIRYALRTLAAQPAWTAAALFCLAVGMGANTAAFSVINGVLLRPLPFPEPEELVMVALRRSDAPSPRPFSLDEYRRIAPEARAFEALSVRTYLPAAVSVDGPPRMVQTELVAPNYFDLLRVRPLAGRFFRSSKEDPAAGPPEAVLSEPFWRTRFAAQASAIGRIIRVNGVRVTVIGVAPRGFVGAMQLLASDLWFPASMLRILSPSAEPAVDTTPMFGAVGRLGAGVTAEQARSQLDVICARLPRARSEDPPTSAFVEPARGMGVPPAIRGTLLGGSVLLFGLGALVVATAVANVAGLMLVRSSARRREISVRMAVGAGSGHIVRQILTESLVLGLAGGVLGMLTAAWLTRVATSFGTYLPEHLAYAIDVQPDWRVLVYSIAASIIVALLFGLVPARRAARTDLVEALKQGGTSRLPRTSRALNALVVGQVSISTVLLVTAGLLARTYINTIAVDPGIDTRNALSISVDVAQAGYTEAEGRALYERLLTRLAALPGIESVSLSRETPLAGAGRSVTISPVADSAGELSATVSGGSMAVTPGYFGTMRILIPGGREFKPSDGNGVVILNETMARLLWPSSSAVGRYIRLVEPAGGPLEVIGVVRDSKTRTLTEAPRPLLYQPLAQQYSPQFAVVIRSHVAPHTISEAVRAEVHSASRDLAVVDLRTMDDQVRAAGAPARQRAAILAAICGVALLLSSVGLYGVVAYGTRQRGREFGLRMALGSQRSQVRSMVLGQGLKLTAWGLCIGGAASLALSRLMARVLFGVQPYDPVTLAGVAAVLGFISLAATYLPAQWATRVDPMMALRAE